MIPSRVQVPHQYFISLFILSHHPVQTGRTPEVHQSPVDSPYLPAPGRLNQGINQTFKRQNLYWVQSCKLRDCKLKLRHCCFFVFFFFAKSKIIILSLSVQQLQLGTRAAPSPLWWQSGCFPPSPVPWELAFGHKSKCLTVGARYCGRGDFAAGSHAGSQGVSNLDKC